MCRVLIDTSVWFDIAQDSRRFPELAAIEEMIRRGLLELIVPQLAIDEFHKRREDIAIANSVSLGPHVRHIKAFATRVDFDKKKVAAILEFLDELSSYSSLESEATRQALDRIERLLLAAPAIPSSQAVLDGAVQRGVEKRAPFLDSNGMADAILFETYAAQVRGNSESVRFAFVTHNKHDFSDTHVNDNLPHPHLADTFAADRSFYFIDLVSALRQIAPDVVSEVFSRTQPTVRDLIEKYLEENTDIGQSPRLLLQRLSRMEIAKRQATKLRASDLLEHTRVRRKKVAASTAMHDYMCLKGVFLWAHTNWSTDVSVEVIERARSAALSQNLLSRYVEAPVRRLSIEDEERLMAAFRERQKDPTTRINMVDVVQFALWSARRRDEICRLRWEDFNREASTCIVRDVWKKGSKITFPLIGRALEIVIRRQKEAENKELIFPYESKSVGAAFTQVKKELGLQFTFSELREEGLRRLVEARQYSIALVQRLDRKKVLDIQAQIEAAGG